MGDHQLQAQVRIHMTGGLPEDDVINTWCFDGGIAGATPVDTANDAHDRLTDYYLALRAQGLYAQPTNPVFDVKWYNLADPSPGRVPVLERTLSIGAAPGGISYPHEVAICVSFEADPVDGMRPQWLRGRVFLGPIQEGNTVISGGKTMIANGLQDGIRTATENFLRAGDDDAHLAIYSPTFRFGRDATSGGAAGGAGPLPPVDPHTLAESVNDVKSGWVDNAWDTIRSRGEKASRRVTFTDA